MEFWKEIRRRVLTNELSQRAACKKYGLGWHTLKKILEHEEPPGYRKSQPRRSRSSSSSCRSFMRSSRRPAGSEEAAAHGAAHLRAAAGRAPVRRRVHDRQGRRAGLEAVAPRSLCRCRIRRAKPRSISAKLRIRLGGQDVKVAMFVMTLPYSDAIFCQVFPRECTETFLEGHRRAFEFFGGVPRRISYDNSDRRGQDHRWPRAEADPGVPAAGEPLSVRASLLPGAAAQRERARREPDWASPGATSWCRSRRSTAGQRSMDSSARACRQDLQQRTARQAGAQERAAGRGAGGLPAAAQAGVRGPAGDDAAANSLSLVRFECNDYSVPTQYAHRKVTVIGRIEEVRLVFEDRLVARHPGAGAGSRRSSIRSTIWPCWNASRADSTTPGRWRTGNCPTALGSSTPARGGRLEARHASSSRCCGCWSSSPWPN